MKKIFRLVHPTARANAVSAVQQAQDGHVVTIAEPSRTLDQNATQWPILEAFAKQAQWPVNGRMEWITAEDWKDILTCAFRNEHPRVAAGLNGGMVLLGQRTSKFSKREFSDWIEFLYATAAERGVVVHADEAAA